MSVGRNHYLCRDESKEQVWTIRYEQLKHKTSQSFRELGIFSNFVRSKWKSAWQDMI